MTSQLARDTSASAPIAVAGVQMNVPAGSSNVPAMIRQIDVLMARFPWVDMVLFSELAMSGPVPNQPVTLPGPEEEALQTAAASHGIWLITGSVFELGPDGQIYNTASVIDPNGAIVTRYRKMFPFLPYEHGITPGSEACVFDVPGTGRFGLSICYDMWFPETSRTLTSLGAEVILHPVLTSTADRDVELAMARATAAQFQCYVVDVNGLGAGGVGRSCVVDAEGHVLHSGGSGEEIMPLEIDLGQVRRQRERGLKGLGQVLKSFRDRRVDFTIYNRDKWTDPYLNSLGPLVMPTRALSEGSADPTPDPTSVSNTFPAPLVASGAAKKT